MKLQTFVGVVETNLGTLATQQGNSFVDATFQEAKLPRLSLSIFHGASKPFPHEHWKANVIKDKQQQKENWLWVVRKWLF